jgi:oxygen-dependent protoporphyrinogen oxidase
MSSKKEVIVIGAGLTGLATGYYLGKAGRDYIILEKENRTGGVINTSAENGFIYENGPNTGVLSTPELALLFEDLDEYCKLEIANPQAKKRYIMKSGKWTALPSGPVSAINTPLFTLKDKFRILGEPFRKPGTDPNESVAQLVRRRLGKSFLDYAVNPFISGVYAGDPEKLITRFALPKLYALEQNYGSFIKGSIAKARQPKTPDEKKATRDVFSVKGGLGNFIDALTKANGKDRIRTGLPSITINKTAEGYRVSVKESNGNVADYEAPVVVTTIGGHALPEVLPFVNRILMKGVSQLEYAKVIQVSVGYKKWTASPLDAFGGLVPEVEKRKILGILFPSAIFGDRAPSEGALLSVFMGGTRNPELMEYGDDELIKIVTEEIGGTLWCKKDPDFLKINRYLHAIPQYGKESEIKLENIRTLQQMYPGLILAGNIRDGIGMADRVKQAKTVADMLY